MVKKKKRGRPPSNPNPNPNPYRRPFAGGRRKARRNPSPGAGAEEDDDADGGGREKDLSLVLRSPSNDELGSDSEPWTEKAGRHESDVKVMDAPQEPSVSGPTTPLPDKKLLVFILDRLQKKDTHGVFSEPVDLEELPDYHDIIKHPMDFKTIRKKLWDGAYANLEQFEEDVYLISSNAMQYNAPDTIFFRQARAILEKAKKDFESLRQESDDNEREPRPARRGRPPMKNILKKLARTEHSGPDFSSNTNTEITGVNGLSNFSSDLSQRASDRPYSLRYTEAPSFTAEHKQDRHEEFPGSTTRGISLRNTKKFVMPDEDRRNMYKQPQLLGPTHEQYVLATFDGERKQLMPVGVHVELAYARSVARFATNLGPAGWEFAARLIERAVPPGTNFGRGWVGENDVPQPSQPLPFGMCPSHSSEPETMPVDAEASAAEQPPINSTVEEARSSPEHSVGDTEFARNCESNGHDMRLKTPFHLHQGQTSQSTLNGFTNQMGFNCPSQAGNAIAEATMTHSQALDMVYKNNNNFMHHSTMGHPNLHRITPESDPRLHSNSGMELHDPSPDLKQNNAPPDLNVGFQSPGSPVSGMLIDSQHPDLALQL